MAQTFSFRQFGLYEIELHYIKRIDHLYDKSVNARIHVTQLSFINLLYFLKLKCENGELNKNEVNYSNINYIYLSSHIVQI